MLPQKNGWLNKGLIAKNSLLPFELLLLIMETPEDTYNNTGYCHCYFLPTRTTATEDTTHFGLKKINLKLTGKFPYFWLAFIVPFYRCFRGC